MRRVSLAMTVLTACAVLAPVVAHARPPYQATFRKQYGVKDGSNLAKADCSLCHSPNDFAERNPYGADLAKALGKADAEPEETVAALKKIEAKMSPDKKTKYVDLIKADKLPGGAPVAK